MRLVTSLSSDRVACAQLLAHRCTEYSYGYKARGDTCASGLGEFTAVREGARCDCVHARPRSGAPRVVERQVPCVARVCGLSGLTDGCHVWGPML